MIVRSCTLEDIRKIELAPEHINEDPRVLIPPEVDEQRFNEILAPRSWTVEENGLPVACFGFLERWEGVAEVWAVYSPWILERPKELLRLTREKLDWTQEHLCIRRFQTSVREHFGAGHRWVLHLGFIPEGRMPGYGLHGDTHILYSRIR